MVNLLIGLVVGFVIACAVWLPLIKKLLRGLNEAKEGFVGLSERFSEMSAKLDDYDDEHIGDAGRLE